MNIKDIGWIKEELCLECPDAPMETCKCGCMKKAIINAIEYLKSENANLRGNLVAAQKVIEAERKPPADLFADLSDDDKCKAEMLAMRDMVALCEQRLARAAEERDAAVKEIFQWVGCPACKYWDSEDEWCNKHDREAGSEDGCSSPEWRGLEKER